MQWEHFLTVFFSPFEILQLNANGVYKLQYKLYRKHLYNKMHEYVFLYNHSWRVFWNVNKFLFLYVISYIVEILDYMRNIFSLIESFLNIYSFTHYF